MKYLGDEFTLNGSWQQIDAPGVGFHRFTLRNAAGNDAILLSHDEGTTTIGFLNAGDARTFKEMSTGSVWVKGTAAQKIYWDNGDEYGISAAITTGDINVGDVGVTSLPATLLMATYTFSGSDPTETVDLDTIFGFVTAQNLVMVAARAPLANAGTIYLKQGTDVGNHMDPAEGFAIDLGGRFYFSSSSISFEGDVDDKVEITLIKV